MTPHLNLGLAGGLIPRNPTALTPEVAGRIAALGVRAIVTHFGTPPERIPGAVAERVRATLRDAGLRISQASGYDPNLVHPDTATRTSELGRMRGAIAAARALGAEMVITGCGSLHPSGFYGPSPLNHASETRRRLIDSLWRVAEWAAEAALPVALECHLLTTLDSPDSIAEVLEAVDSPWIVANFDPVNLIGDLPTLYNSGEAVRRMWKGVGARWSRRSIHLKDIAVRPEFVLHLSEVPPGEGLLDYAAVFAICRELDEGAALIVEHLDDGQVPAALRFVRSQAVTCGVTIA